jgi:hypothetical protein
VNPPYAVASPQAMTHLGHSRRAFGSLPGPFERSSFCCAAKTDRFTALQRTPGDVVGVCCHSGAAIAYSETSAEREIR